MLTALVFDAPRDGPLRYSNTHRGLSDPARSSAGASLHDITPHDVRHTCASLTRAAGEDVKAIQQQLVPHGSGCGTRTHDERINSSSRVDTLTCGYARKPDILSLFCSVHYNG